MGECLDMFARLYVSFYVEGIGVYPHQCPNAFARVHLLTVMQTVSYAVRSVSFYINHAMARLPRTGPAPESPL